ncbi:hypothetical protein CJD35_20685 (plasmid) [Sphingobium xenophagum]|uniref:DUF3597 domain-containing protein n=1 Tax=Sphingobium xenophagum TaxID=121428 RepID=A0A249N0F7_SPHXE|nr:DUF3597 domain-containing protein [Sphingobium xenophagum]ASY46904.1 hypothetical protein CJD35_20685 [Sphingobium xenophagum]
MSIFGNILSKIFHPNAAKAAPRVLRPPPRCRAKSRPSPHDPCSGPAAAAPAQTSVDVGPVLEAMAAMKDDHGGNYKTSIVDLLKLLDLDSSLTARKELAEELGVNAGEPGSAEQNIALHRAVMDKLAENGGIVPDDMRN